MNKRLLLFLMGIAFAFQLTSLNGQGLKAIADKQYELEAYELAIENYKKVLIKAPKDAETMFNLAESYRLSNNDTEALNWYDQLTALETFNPKAYLNYGRILKSAGDLDNAKFWFLKYAEFDEEKGNNFAMSCEVAKELMQEEHKYEISLFVDNSEASDFGVSFDGDKLIYCSFRSDITSSALSTNKAMMNSQGNQIFTSDMTSSEMLRNNLRSSHHLGPVAYAENSAVVAYTKNNFRDAMKFVRSDDANMSLFLAEKEEGSSDFTNERPFPYNETGFSTGFASLANKGNLLYFASNRPGGFGGYDLYMSQFKDGAWSEPVNLGANVNTAGNEITPFFSDEDNFLFFASDYRAGLGGFDNFLAERISALEYDLAINMGKGVNSSDDDYFFSISPATDEYYFTSNRLGGAGNDDIYMASPVDAPMMAMEEVSPPALDLEDIAVKGTVVNTDNAALTSDPAFYLVNNNFSLEDARLLAKTNLILSAPPSKVYYVQVASLSSTQGSVSGYKKLTALGNLYKVHKSSATKIRLGYYYERNDAAKVLSSVKGMGFNDAFIVHEPLLTSELELVGDAKNGTGVGTFSSNFKPAPAASSYKVRLASYTEPLWFDLTRVQDLGEIEQWTKGQYTIFILSGYGNLENAEKAMIKAKNRGFKDAHIVVDKGGFIVKLKEN